MTREIRYQNNTQTPCKISEVLKDKGFSRQNITDIKYKDSGVYVGENKVLMNHILNPGDEFILRIIENEKSGKIPPVKLPFEPVYEDEDLIVVNKTYDMPIHPSLNNYYNTLGNAAAYYFAQRGEDFVFRVINRLDRDTTGLTLIAKHSVSAGMLHAQQRQGLLGKEYTAIVCGRLNPAEGSVDLPIGREKDSSIMRRVDMENGDRAFTQYKTIRTNDSYSLVKLRLETGRTHQIRVHMKAMGCPLAGDFLYNPEDKSIGRQALHVNRLEFLQPITGEKIILEANIPDDMKALI